MNWRSLTGGLLLCVSLSWAQETPWKGRYRLWLSGDASWHNHALEIESCTPEDLEGVVEVDLGLGPEGREPSPDETLHKVKFKAHRAAEGAAYVAEVMVGNVQPKVYRFELYPMEEGKSWSGITLMGNRKTGVLARRD
jgi:hypothetical protein